MVVGARQSFQFFKQITWFLGNNRALPYFRYRILHKIFKKSVHKSQFQINHASFSASKSSGIQSKALERSERNSTHKIFIVLGIFPIFFKS